MTERSAPLRVVDGADSSATLVAPDGRPLATYSWHPRRNHPHFRDVRPLTHDGQLTTTAPWDHRWHHGLWFAWKFIDDVNFWEDAHGFGQPRLPLLGLARVIEHGASEADGQIRIAQRLHWLREDSPSPVLAETRTTTIIILDDETWAIDWDMTWEAVDAPRVLSATSRRDYPWGGYGGLTYRAARSMVEQERILASDDGQPFVGHAATHGRSVNWLAYGGFVDGAHSHLPDRPAAGGVAILMHPENLSNTVFVESATVSMGFVGAAPLFDGDVTVTPGEPLRLRYRTVILGDLPDRARMDALYSQFVSVGSA